MDANLWASLVSVIFQKLDEYINKNSKEGEVDNLKKEISSELYLFKIQKEELNSKKEEAEQEHKKLTERKEKLKITLNQNQEKLKTEYNKNIFEEVYSGVNYDDKLKELLNEWGIQKEDIKNLSPNNILEHVKSAKSITKQVLSFNWQQYLLIITVVLVSITMYSGIITVEYLSDTLQKTIKYLTFYIVPITGVLAKVKSTISKYTPLVNGIIQKKDEYEKAYENVKLIHEQEVNKLTLNIAEKEDKLNTISNEINNIELQIDSFQYDIDHNFSHVVLSRFIAKKANGSDYDKYLGIISLIRKDLETLSYLLVSSQV